MKPNKKAVVPTPAQIRRKEWNRLTQFPQFDKKLGELHSDREKRLLKTLHTIDHFGNLDEWFSINFPLPFRSHWSRSAMLAETACRHLRKIALYDNKDAIETLARITVEMTETLTELLTKKSPTAKKNEALINEFNAKFSANFSLEENTKLLQEVACDIPYWPMLRFLNAAGNAEEQFQLLAEKLKLGETCPINVSKKANYNLDVPINSFVWKCLRHFQKAHWSIGFNFEHGNVFFPAPATPAKTFDEAIAPIVFQKVKTPPIGKPFITGMIPERDIGIYKVSYYLPPLTKFTAKDWADKAIMPYVCSNYPDFSKVPEFSNLLRRDSVKTRGQQRKEIRKDILRALTSLARKT